MTDRERVIGDLVAHGLPRPLAQAVCDYLTEQVDTLQPGQHATVDPAEFARWWQRHRLNSPPGRGSHHSPRPK